MAITVPRSLAEHLRQRRCTLFVGAGLSVGAGLPDWKGLLKSMVEKLEGEGAHSAAYAEAYELIEAGKLTEVADYCRHNLGERRYLELLSDTLRGGSGSLPSTHEIIARLPFREVVTTNYDKLLERAYAKFRGDLPTVVTGSNRESLGSLLFNRRFFILKAHGDIDDVASLVLTAQDYRRTIHSNPAFDAFFSALLLTRVILFIGYSLSDRDFSLLMDRQLAAFGQNVPERYAVMAGVGELERDVLKRAANITVLTYPEDKHEELTAFLHELEKSLIDPRGAQTVGALSSPASVARVPGAESSPPIRR